MGTLELMAAIGKMVVKMEMVMDIIRSVENPISRGDQGRAQIEIRDVKTLKGFLWQPEQALIRWYAKP